MTSVLQKSKAKRLDLFFVTVANSFLGETCKKQKLQLQVKKYENSPSNQQKSRVYTCTHLSRGFPCRRSGSINIHVGIAGRCCSIHSAHPKSNTNILQSRGFRCVPRATHFDAGEK